MPEAARVQEAEHLELRALAALEAAKRLEDAALAEHDRAVGLLAADRPHRLEGRLGGQRGSELELDAAGFGRQARRAPQGREQRARKRGIGQPEHDLAVLGDAVGELVELVAAVGELGLEQGDHAPRRECAAV